MDHTYPLDYLHVHKALHSLDAYEVEFEGVIYPILCHRKNRYRFVVIHKGDVRITVCQQNLSKASPYADRARRGERITWIMSSNSTNWKKIDRFTEAKYPKLFSTEA